MKLSWFVEINSFVPYCFVKLAGQMADELKEEIRNRQ